MTRIYTLLALFLLAGCSESVKIDGPKNVDPFYAVVSSCHEKILKIDKKDPGASAEVAALLNKELDAVRENPTFSDKAAAKYTIKKLEFTVDEKTGATTILIQTNESDKTLLLHQDMTIDVK